MSWRIVVISHRAKLDYRMEFMIVRGEETVKVHLSEISTLIIESTEVSLTAALLSELTKKGFWELNVVFKQYLCYTKNIEIK